MRVTSHRYAVDGWGVGELWTAAAGVVVEHEPPTPPRGAAGPPRETLAAPVARRGDAFAAEVLQLIHSYFAGRRVELGDVPVDLEWCTPFQRAVAEALRRVPWGEVVTYAELAALAGHPNAQRAAGTFCAGNRLSLLVPCHRVVAAGGIGSYGSTGVAYKRRLLALEGVRL